MVYFKEYFSVWSLDSRGLDFPVENLEGRNVEYFTF